MKLAMPCMQCFSKAEQPDLDFVEVELRDDGCYTFTCRHGHRNVTVVQEQKFEILFELGANAIFDGYCREAVSCFSASLERFYEFYVQCCCIESKVSEMEMERAWKEVRNQSERQLGAFIYAFLLKCGSAPPLLGEKMRKFRNAVIHKGRIPDRKEAVRFGQEVLDQMLPLIDRLRSDSEEAVRRAVFLHVKNAGENAPDDAVRSGMSLSTIVGLANGGLQAGKDLESELRDLAMRRKAKSSMF